MATPIAKFEIHLEHDIDEQYQYEPGENLRGEVILANRELINLKAITVTIKGEATVGWDSEGGRRDATCADEAYVEESVDLVSAGNDIGDVLKIEPGVHSYELEYQLPHNLPSSFIGKYGSITYVVKATLKEDKRFGLSTTITSEPFLVLRKLDINKEPKLLLKRHEKVEERFYGTLFCLNGKVSAEVTVDKTGHLPGEDMLLDAEVTNGSPRTIVALQAALVMHSTFHARNQSRSHVQIVNKKRDEYEIGYGDNRTWSKVRLTIPRYIPESRLDGCDIIDITYLLEFRVELAKRKELKVAMPITVGTYDGSNMEIADQPKRYIKKQEAGTINRITRPSMQPNGAVNGAGLEGDEGFDLDMDDEDHRNFRLPMNPGDTRSNPLFSTDNTDL